MDEKIESLLLGVEKELEVLKRPDLAMLITIVRVAEACGMARRLIDVVRSFYNNEIPWIGASKQEDEEIQKWVERVLSRRE
ncbi:hypothetical protein LCGC14_0506650 [marine sediment metagenome]|uniref:Uncharacterized protein n=1 Tax=marine sediment metagenome TaxID=412755 RepID=A0A0F9S2F0_9ZZZZ